MEVWTKKGTIQNVSFIVFAQNQAPSNMQQQLQQLSSNQMIQQALQTATSGMSTMPTGNMMQSSVGSSGANVMNVVGNSNIQQPVSRNLDIFIFFFGQTQFKPKNVFRRSFCAISQCSSSAISHQTTARTAISDRIMDQRVTTVRHPNHR